MRAAILLILGFSVSIWGPAQGLAAEGLSLLPRPVRMEVKEGRFVLTEQTQIFYTSPGAKVGAMYLAAVLSPPTGFAFKAEPLFASTPESGSYILLTDEGSDRNMKPEAYSLKVTPAGVVIQSRTSAGVFYGAQTLRQLFPPQILAGEKQQGVEWSSPAVEIQDAPRYAWRGLMIDSARHYIPGADVARIIDLMALHKLNTLHWHLTDDQGWRIEIKKYPKLTEIGSRRDESPMRGDRKAGDKTPSGPSFYTQEEIRELVHYAQTRFVTIVPEIEMPGHSTAALAAYPELSCTGGPFKVATRWGVHRDVYCAGNDQAIQFNKDVLEEVMRLFPGQYVHIGGDECPKDRWNACPRCQERIKANGLKDAHELQSWFIKQMMPLVGEKKKRLIGWDEIMDGGLAPDACVMSWRGEKKGIEAATQGHDVVMSPKSHCYLDYAQSKAKGEPEAIGGHLTLAKVYSFNPTPAAIPEDKAKHILGVQGNLWGEYIRDAKDLDYFAFPRACALAEIGWTAQEKKDFGDFWNRLETHLKRLDVLKVGYRKLSDDQKTP